MKGNILVSILIPVYNREKWIYDCLNSIVNQTYRNIEIIIYDDGSSDNSLNIIYSFVKQDARIHLIVGGKNKGVSEARTRLLENIRGKYVFFVDSDDIIDLRMVEKVVAVAEKENVDLVYYRFLLNKGIYCMPQIKQYLPNGKHNIEFVKKYYFKNPINLFYSSLCNKCYKSTLLGECSNMFEPVMEDVFFNIEYLSKVQNCYVLPDHFYTYNQMNESMTRKTKKVNAIDNDERWKIDKALFNRIINAFNVSRDREINDLIKYFYIRYSKQKKCNNKKSIIEFLGEIETAFDIKQINFYFWNLIIYKEKVKQVLKRTIKKMLKIS